MALLRRTATWQDASINSALYRLSSRHAFLGLHLAKKLEAQGHKVTILNDGDPVSSH